MQLTVSEIEVRSILTRSSGFLKTVTSHSLQPYRGCSFGNSLCGVACYVQHNRFITRGAPWGSFLQVKRNAVAAYAVEYERERRWARRSRDRFAVFMSSSTDPFVPQEDRFRITAGLLEAMCDRPPDELILQTHTDRVARHLDLLLRLADATRLRVHISIESDRDRIPGLPAPACSVDRRMNAAATLRRAGIPVVIAVAPLLPIRDPEAFFERIALSADGVILDHFIGGDGSRAGARTLKTALPEAMAQVDPLSTRLDYRERMVEVAGTAMPGRVGVSVDGFAGRYLAKHGVEEQP